MRVLYLFNKVVAESIERTRTKGGPTNEFFGFFELQKKGIDAGVLELEQYLPPRLVRFLRKHVLTMHYAHLPLFPFFFRYDIIFTSTAYSSLILKALLGIKRFKWIILDFNILGTIGKGTTLRQRFFAWAVGKSDGIVAISQAECDALRVRFPHLRDRIIFLHEPTSLDVFTPMWVDKEDIDVLTVGNYGRDPKMLLAAAKETAWHVTFAGKQPSDWPKDLPSRIHAERYPVDAMQALYGRSKVAAVLVKTDPDFFDSVGTLSVGEALASGKATVVTHTANMESYITDGENGVFVPAGDSVALRMAIEKLLADASLRERLGLNARAWAEKHLNPEVFVDRLQDFFDQVMAVH